MSRKREQQHVDEAEEVDNSPRVNLSLDFRDRTLTPDKIATLFIEIAQRAEKCFDFEISRWLSTYEELRSTPNFAEAALLISSASQIYARKVDFLEGMVLDMCEEEEKEAAAATEGEDQQKKVGRRKGRRPKTLTEALPEVELVVKEVTTLPKSKLTETVHSKETQFGSSWEKFKATKCRFNVVNGKKKLVLSRQLLDEMEFNDESAQTGQSYIYDYDGEEVIGLRSDFCCFSGTIRPGTHQLMSDFSYKDLLSDTSPLSQSFSLPPNVTEFSDLSPVKNPEVARTSSTPVPEHRSLVSVDSGFQSIITNDSQEILPAETEEFFDAVDSFESPEESHDMSELRNLANDRLSVDEGISIKSPTSMSEFDGLSPFSLPPLSLSPVLLRGWINKYNLFEIEDRFLLHNEDFDLPLELKVVPVPVLLNIFGIPEKKLRKKSLFSLPPEDFVTKNRYIKLPLEPRTPRIFKPHFISDQGLEFSLELSSSDDVGEFLGFTALEIGGKISHSTPIAEEVEGSTKRAAEELLEQDPKRLSFDSELLTEDESEKGAENGPSKVTPERISKTSPRMSRDSGIKSPSPMPEGSQDELLTIIVEEEDAVSEVSFRTADDGIPKSMEMPISKPAGNEQVQEMKFLADRVSRWHEYLKPILKHSEERGHFEIHEYGSQVMDSFPGGTEELGHEMTFQDVMSDKPQDSIARYFLSTLMLVNTGNVQMTTNKSSPPQVVDPRELRLKLVSRARVHEAIENMDEAVPCCSTKRKRKGGGSTNKRPREELVR